MRILVTGSTGHIGRALSARLASAGHEVVGLSRRGEGSPGGWDEVSGDVAARGIAAALRERVQPCQAIVHAAASRDPDPFAASLALTNCVGTQHMLQLAAAWGTRHFVYLSGVTVVGVPRSLPVTEEHPADPPSAYLASKLFGEHLVRAASAARQDLWGVSLRVTSPVGPGMRDRRIFRVFVERALEGKPLRVLGTGKRRQNYVDVRDVAQAVERALAYEASGIFNVGAKTTVSNLELARLCVECLGSSSAIDLTGERDPEEGIAWEVSVAKAERVLGYVPLVSIQESIRSVAEECMRDEG